jgi:D-alanyl-D-alanine carboxypeptidase
MLTQRRFHGSDSIRAGEIAATMWAACLSAALVLVLLLPTGQAARAQVGSERYSSIVIDAGSGRVLSEVNADAPRHPASLTKMMTLYMTFEALRDRRISLDENVPVSAHAASMQPTKLDLVPGTRITVEQAILGMVTKSANDAACAMGEMLGGGDEARFAQMMTLRARALGMSHTEFHNASGLPDPDQWSTARDLALLARHLIQDFPSQYRYFSTASFRFHGRAVLGHDHMLQTYAGADGLKTGYTEASGFNMVTSAVRDNARLIGVVMGAAHAGERDLHMAALLDQGFERMGVPGEPRHEAPGGGLLIASAHAATLPPPARPHPPAFRSLPLRSPPPRSPPWSIQVGAFSTEAVAQQAAATAHRLAGVGEVRLEETKLRGRRAWRAQLVGLSEADAHNTCASIARHRQSCAVLRPEARQFVSR